MKKCLLLNLVGLLILSHGLFAQTYNYAEALQKSIFFYECQRSGDLENWSVPNRVTWRANSAMNDSTETGGDLTGGWYDAGDHVKFNFPMSFSATVISWGVIEFIDGYKSTGQLDYMLNNLRWVAEYLLKCHTAPNELYGQVGNGKTDHGFWGAAEIMKMVRPSYKIDATHPGSDLAAETAAAMAAMSIVFRSVDPAFSDTLVTHAKQLYNFADTYRGLYHLSITDATAYYKSWSGYQDELVWGAIWLYKATGNNSYLTKATDYYESMNLEPYTSVRSYKWGFAWDDKSYGNYLLMASIKGNDEYFIDIERHLDYWTSGYNGQKIKYTPGGLAWLDQWGANRYAANTSFLALIYSKYFPSRPKKTKYYNFAVSQIDYMLGSNPQNRSYVCGFGNNPPLNPHHRTATGCWVNSVSSTYPVTNRHILYGALVGGPNAADGYTDDRTNYTNNEVACDYNAAFTGALAKLAGDKGGKILNYFPIKEVPDSEFLVEARAITNAKNYSLISIWFNNRTAWPARSTYKGSIRYFIDISEGVALGYKPSSYNASVGSIKYNLMPYDVNKSIYYVEVLYNTELYPGGNSQTRKEIQLRISLPTTVPVGAWDPTNDFSYQGINLGTTLSFVNNISMYDNGLFLTGNEPTISTDNKSILVDKNNSNVSVFQDFKSSLLYVKSINELNMIEIYNNQGQKIVSKKLFVNETQILISNLPKGLYIVKCILQNNQTYISKIIKR